MVVLCVCMSVKCMLLCVLGVMLSCCLSQGHYLAVGTNSGGVQIWDPVAVKHVNTLSGHSARVGK